MYDSFLIFTYGGPEGEDEIDPFLRNVANGKNIPVQRLNKVREHYALFEGKSPLNPYTRKFIAELKNRISLPIYHASLYSRPTLEDAVSELTADARRSVLVFTPDPFGSYTRPYLEKLENLRKDCGHVFPETKFVPLFFEDERFLCANTAAILDTLREWEPSRAAAANYVFSLHSLPERAAKEICYDSNAETCVRKIREKLAEHSIFGTFSIAWQSESPTREPWLRPRLEEVLRQIAESSESRDVVLTPVGFLFENLEISYDLDLEAAALCRELGLTLTRVSTVGLRPEFLAKISEMCVANF